MKKIIVTGLLGLAAGSALAVNICNSSTTAVTSVVSTGSAFVKSAFTPVCSANSIVDYAQDTGKLWAAGVSAKGASSFKGNTAGGAVTKHLNCTSNPCATGDVSTALTAAEALGST